MAVNVLQLKGNTFSLAHNSSRTKIVSCPFQRKMLYLRLDEPPDFKGDNWVNVDTFFALVDCILFSKLVDFHDSIDGIAVDQEGTQKYEAASARSHGSPGRFGNKVRVCLSH